MPVTIATQNPNTKTTGISSKLLFAVRSGMWTRPTIVTMPTAKLASKRVDLDVSTVAAIVTGARTSRANGLLSPPVKANSKESCNVSKSNVNTVSASDRRRLSGKITTANKFVRTDSPIAIAQGPSASFKPYSC